MTTCDSIPGMVALTVTGLLLPGAVLLPKYPGSLNVLPSAICMLAHTLCSSSCQLDLSTMCITICLTVQRRAEALERQLLSEAQVQVDKQH